MGFHHVYQLFYVLLNKYFMFYALSINNYQLTNDLLLLYQVIYVLVSENV